MNRKWMRAVTILQAAWLSKKKQQHTAHTKVRYHYQILKRMKINIEKRFDIEDQDM